MLFEPSELLPRIPWELCQKTSRVYGPTFCHVFTPVHSLSRTSSTLDCNLAECICLSMGPILLPESEKSVFSGQSCAFGWTGWGSSFLSLGQNTWGKSAQKDEGFIVAFSFSPCLSSPVALGLWRRRMTGQMCTAEKSDCFMVARTRWREGWPGRRGLDGWREGGKEGGRKG